MQSQNSGKQPRVSELALRLALVPVLTGWAKVCPKANSTEAVDADTVEIYAESLAEIKITPEELETTRRTLLRTNKYFPTVAEITEHVLENRDQNPYRGWKCCEDADGLPWVAPPELVRNGIYVPHGGGNGMPLPPREERDGDREKVDRLLGAPDHRRPLALGTGKPQIKLTVERQAELIEEAKQTAERRRNGETL